jgi:hypothetical protein
VEEFVVNGQRVSVDTSDSPSSSELLNRIDAALAEMSVPTPAPAEAPVQDSVQGAVVQPSTQDQPGMWDTIVNNVSEIPEGIAAGATKAAANTSALIDRVTGDSFSQWGDWMNENVANLGYIHIGKDGRISWTDHKVDEAGNPSEQDNPIELFNTETVTGDVTEGISQFVTGLIMTRGAGMTGTTATSLAGQAVIAENLAFNPYEDRLSNLIQEYPSLENPITEFLAADPNDTEIEARFKMSLEALGMEAAGAAVFSGVKAYRNYSKGLEADPEDLKTIQDWADAHAPKVDVGLAELDAKMAKAVEAEARLRETYAAAERNKGVLTPESVAKIKEGARKTGIQETPDDVVTRGQAEYGYGVTKTNETLIRQADDVIVEAFVDSPSVLKGIENLRASLDGKDFDIYVASAGRVLQMTSRNLAAANRGLRSAEKEIGDAFKQLDARTDLSPEELVTAKTDLQDRLLAHQQSFREIRNDYIESVMFFRGGSTTAGRAVQINKLFQGFDVPVQDVEAHFDRLIRRMPDERVRNSFVARAVFALNQKSGDVLKALDEIFIANILTGFKTHVVNTVGNGLTAVYLPTERALAAGVRVLSGDVKGGTDQFQRAMAQFAGIRHSVVESSRLAVEAYKIGDTLLDNATTNEMQRRTIIGRDLPFDKSTLKQLGNWLTPTKESEITLSDLLGTAMRMFSTRALATEDELFKNLNFRGKIYGESYVDALNAAKANGLTGAEARAAASAQASISVQRGVTEQMMLNRNGLPDGLGFEDYRSSALQYAREATYTQNLEKGGRAFQNAVEHIPLARQVFPFVRTPLNLISASIQRSPLAPVSGRWREDFMAGGERRALAFTRLAMGTAIVTKFMNDFGEQDAKFEFQGAGPAQVGARQNAQELGGVLYGSIRFADGTQYQISRFDPFSTIFEGLGTIQDLHRSGKFEEAENATLSYGLAIASMLANDTYATSVRQIMQAMQDENGLDKFLKGRVSQLMPMSGLSKNYNQSVDPLQRELRSYTDALKSGLPGMTGDLPPRYNLLGEAVEAPKYATIGIFPEGLETMMSPIMSGKVKTDPVAVEFVNQNITTLKQSPFIVGGAIDLNNQLYAVDALGKPIYGDNVTAYDRFNDIMASERLFGSYTLREFLEKTITSKDYADNLTDSIRIDTPTGRKKSIAYAGSRKDILTAIVSDAKVYALEILAQENPRFEEALRLAQSAPTMAKGTVNDQQQLVNDNQALIEQLNAPLTGN